MWAAWREEQAPREEGGEEGRRGFQAFQLPLWGPEGGKPWAEEGDPVGQS